MKLSTFIVLLFASAAFSQTFVENDLRIQPRGAGHEFRIGEFDEFPFSMSDLVLGDFIDGPYVLFEVSPGDVLTKETLNQRDLSSNGLRPTSLQQVPLGESYFGFGLSAFFYEDPDADWQGIGWVQFSRNEDEIQTLRSLMSYGDENGVGVTVVPEPSTSLLLPFVAVLICFRRNASIRGIPRARIH